METFVVKITGNTDAYSKPVKESYVLSVAHNGQILSSTHNRARATKLNGQEVNAIAEYKQRNSVRLRKVNFTVE